MGYRLETKRLILRPRSLQDLESYLAMDLDPQVVRFIRPTPPEEEHRVYLRERFKMVFEDGLGIWSVFEKKKTSEVGDFIGWAVLVPLGGEGPEIEIGYRFVQKAWGKGYATEAALALRDHAFTVVGLDQIVAVTHPDNIASQQVLRKIGLNPAGKRHAYGEELPYFILKSGEMN